MCVSSFSTIPSFSKNLKIVFHDEHRTNKDVFDIFFYI